MPPPSLWRNLDLVFCLRADCLVWPSAVEFPEVFHGRFFKSIHLESFQGDNAAVAMVSIWFQKSSITTWVASPNWSKTYQKKEEKNSSNNWCFFMSPPLVPYKFHLQCHPQTKWNIKVRPCSQSQWHLYPTSETPPRRILLSETTWVRWVIYATESPWRISRYWPPVNGQPVLFVLSQPKKIIFKKKEESQPDEVHLLLEQHLLEFYAQ